MTSYKLCLTLLVLTSVSVSVIAKALCDSSSHRRVRRASPEPQAVESTTEDADNYGFQAGYRFGEEFFLPEASKSIPAEYKKKADGCDRVVKNSMVCMVCKDPKTNAKYEQCSYVGNPPPKSPAARQSHADKEVPYVPETSVESSEAAAPPRGPYENYESSPPSRDSHESPAPSGGPYASSSYPGSYESYEPSTERRSSPDYEPSTSPRAPYEKNYESSTPPRGASYTDYETPSPKSSSTFNYDSESPTPYSYSENYKDTTDSSEDPAESSDCHQIVKDSQTCRVCKDPKTGKSFERCSSSYQPDDKTYAYGKSEKYGYPESRKEYKDEEKPEYRSYEDKSEENKSENAEDRAETSNCRQVKRDDQICTVCKDPKTGSDNERCGSSYSPADKSYSYGTSERYESPGAEGRGEDFKPYGKDEDKSAEASYESPEYQSDFVKSFDEGYKKYHSDQPEEYRPSNYKEAESGYTSPTDYEESSGAEYAAPSVPAANTETKSQGRAGDCREIRKDTMTCTVCTDPKTGRNFEQCSYAYQPDDKVYKYTKSKTFGYPEAGVSSAPRGRPGELRSASRLVDTVRHSASKQVNAVSDHPCKQVQKGSMICTVCKDLKTGINSEQCAYRSKSPKAPASYSSTVSSGNPRKDEEGRGEDSDQEGQQESRAAPQWSKEETRETTAESKESVTVKANPCKQIQKGSMSCTVCKDPKGGGVSEECAYGSKPTGKIFDYGSSGISGKGRKEAKGEEGGESKESDDEEREESRTAPRWSGEVDGQHKVAESKQTEKVKTSPCRRIEKGSMTCTVCKDPKTGASSEQCSYSSKPKENLYTYRKSKTTGKPPKEGKGKDGGDEEPESRETKQVRTTSSPCRTIEKDTMTCKICKDPKTGENSEQCEYSYKPKERHFTYTKSKSFGKPRKNRGDGDGEGSAEEKPEESHHVSRWSTDGDEDHYAKDNRPRGFSKPDWSYNE